MHKCLVAVRPESLLVEPAAGNASSAEASSNQLQATIRTLLFMGESHEADIEFPGGHMALISLPPTRVWHEGESVRISLPPEKLQLWNRDPAVNDCTCRGMEPRIEPIYPASCQGTQSGF